MPLWSADSAGEAAGSLAVPARLALAVGNEGAGLSAEVRALADATVAIRMPGRAESLNVAVAAGVLLHAFTRQRS